jgi:hypothetical protein
MDTRISNFTYVSTQTLQNAFPERAEQRPLQTASQAIAVPKIIDLTLEENKIFDAQIEST